MKVLERLKPNQLALDVLIALVLMTLGLVGSLQIDSGPEYGRDPDALHTVLIVLMTLPLALRRVFPATVFVVVLVAWMCDRGLDYPASLATIALVTVFYTLGAEVSHKRSLLIGGSAAVVLFAWTTLGIALYDSVSVASLVTTMITTATPLLIGREVHERRRRVDELRVRAEQAERDREEQARRAVADERARIARELHDVVAHQMTVMTLQAEGARRVADDSDPRVIEALETISSAGHNALTEMRRMVGLLRIDDTDTDSAPLPHLGDLEDLVNQMRAAGFSVELNITGNVRTLAEGTELSAYRIVQESLTNVVRHGGPEVHATVSVEYGENLLDVTIQDDGRGASANLGDGPGHGLVGMNERVSVLGGELTAGPRSGGGYEVHATIPVMK